MRTLNVAEQRGLLSCCDEWCVLQASGSVDVSVAEGCVEPPTWLPMANKSLPIRVSERQWQTARPSSPTRRKGSTNLSELDSAMQNKVRDLLRNQLEARLQAIESAKQVDDFEQCISLKKQCAALEAQVNGFCNVQRVP